VPAQTMKVYISADLEGVTGVAHWDETLKHKPDDYRTFQEQMTQEVVAACQGALQAGATEIWVKDAHDTGRNLLAARLPEEVKLIRGWSGHPFSMVQELDDSFDAAVFIGYHSRAGADTHPLAHSMTDTLATLTINGLLASEFLLHAYAAALHNVPVVFVSGDEGLCWDVAAINERIQTVAVNSGIGNSIISIHPQLALKKIQEGVVLALQGNLGLCRILLPTEFTLELQYKNHIHAYRAAYYPGASRNGTHGVTFRTDNYFEILRMLLFVI
jgi:D-amino peptidase